LFASQNGRTALHHALLSSVVATADKKDWTVVRTILNYGCNVNLKDEVTLRTSQGRHLGGAGGAFASLLNFKNSDFFVFAYNILIFLHSPPPKEVGQNLAPPGKKLK